MFFMSKRKGPKSGIYKITNKVNQKFYIGSTKNFFSKRWWSHRNDLRLQQHGNKYLQRAWDKYGEKSFTFSVLEEDVPEENLYEREQFWIDTTNCTDPEIGYNIAKLATNPNPREYTEEERRKQSNRIAPGGYLVTMPTGLELHVENLTEFAQAWPEYKLNERGLSACARGEIPQHKGFKCKRADPQYQVEYVKPEDKRLRSFVLFDPQGKRYEVDNLSEFCRQHNIEDQRITLLGCAKGKNYQSKGWQCYYEENAPKEFIPVEELQAQNRKHYFIISPDYQTYTTDYLREFCEKHNLHEGAMRQCTLESSRVTQYKGWQCFEDTEALNKEELLNNLDYFWLQNPQSKEELKIPRPLLKEWCEKKEFNYEYFLRCANKNAKQRTDYFTVDNWYIILLKEKEFISFTPPLIPTKHFEEKGYIITYPDGKEVEVLNLREFAREHNLNPKCLDDCLSGRQSNHRGFKAMYKDINKRKEFISTADSKNKEYVLFDPEGTRYEVSNLRAWLKERGMLKMYVGLVQCATREDSYSCKKWQCFYKENAPKEYLSTKELKKLKSITK
jgi:group I intron endonuclease